MTKRPLPEGAIVVPKIAKKVFTGQIFDTYQWQQKLFDGSYSTFEMLKRPDTVCIIALDKGKVVVEEEEQPYRGRELTLPAGKLDPGEDPLRAAKREMLEETGLSFDKWELKDVVQPHYKLDWFIYTFVAQKVVTRQDPNLEAGERITTKLIDYSELLSLIKNGEMPWSQFLIRLIMQDKTSLDDILKLPTIEV